VSGAEPTLRRIGRNTADLERAIAFYRDVLGFTLTDEHAEAPWTQLLSASKTAPRGARLALGDQTIELTEFPCAAAYPPDANAADLIFQHCAIVTRDIHAAYARLMHCGASAITREGPQTLPPSTGSVTAFKFRDPDGHPLELIHFPPGVGDLHWHEAESETTALGIDHSAISVGDTQRAIRFYQHLGLQVTTRGLNRGREQQRLDDLADVEVEVVALRGATRTPHLELLGYRQPRGRRDATPSASAIVADRCIWQVVDLAAVWRDLARHFPDTLVARGRIDGVAAVLARDPSGHWMTLIDSRH
jgi:catechol 2,3-dioxygenase-like lactoylglutathione lyase family enzyme